MKTFTSLFLLLFVNYFIIAQCSLSDNYSNSTAWTQVGTNVEVSNGKVNFLNGAADSQQRRVYRSLGTTLSSNDTWSAEFDFLPSSVGSWGGPATGHTLLALTAGTQEPFNNCPDLSCSSLPTGNQDGVIVTYVTTNPTDPANHISNTIFFKIHAKDGTTEYRSANILTGNAMNTNYYMKVERTNSTTVQLSVFSDPNRTVHLPNSPLTLTIPSTIDSLTTIQHGNAARGDSRRQLTGTIDNLCLNYNVVTSIQDSNLANETLKVFPNPAKDILTIEGLDNVLATVQMFNTSGQLVVETKEHKLSLAHLSKGIYFIKVQDGNTIRNGKVIVE